MRGSKPLISRLAALSATFALIAVATPSAFATDRWVPKNYRTIQDAINASVDGDDVLVVAGTYHENINLLGKSIAVWSKGPGRATIDGDHLGACVTLDSGKARAYLDGFRLIDGSGKYDKISGESFGGGVCQTAGELDITDCIITGCEATWGGAVFVGSGATAHVVDCVLDRCNKRSAANHGGGIAVFDSTVNMAGTTIQDCGTARYTSAGGGVYSDTSDFFARNTNLITRNAAVSGGGLWLNESDFLVTASIVGNVAAYGGGGAAAYRCRPTSGFTRCEISYNRAEGGSESEGGGLWLVGTDLGVGSSVIHYNRSKRGGGIAILNGSIATIGRCSIRGNSARMGGGIYVNAAEFESNTSIIAENNCLYSPPLPKDGGGGICSVDSTFDLEFCTVTRNQAIANAGGIFHGGIFYSGRYFRRPVMEQTIIWGNGGPGLARNIEDRRAEQPLFLWDCDYELSDDPHPGFSNLQVDPLFDPASFVFDLLASSPLIDISGYSRSTDFDGDPRCQDGDGDGVAECDCGAQEWQ